MKKFFLVFLAVLLSVSALAYETLQTKNNTLVLEAVPGKNLYFWYYGTTIPASDIDNIASTGIARQQAYPCHCNECQREEALSIVQPGGSLGLNPLVKEVRRTAWEGGEILEIFCHDDVYPVAVKSVYKSYVDENVIETWTEIVNEGKKPVVLSRYDSGFLPIRVGNVWISHFAGAWGNEAQVYEEPLTRGMFTIKSKDGNKIANRARSEVMISLDGKPQENSGRVIGAALCWSGNYELRFDTMDSDYHYFFAGINPDNGAYTLEGKQSFQTPALALSFSAEGLGGVSRNFHRWGRNYKIYNGHKDRMVLLNSWEGVYLDIKQPEMDRMIADIAGLGGELFVMDDGWFASEKYNRDKANAALGDWSVDKRKLPDGVEHLVETAKEHGIKFGIWIEPEMTNTKSELYEKHPDWVLRYPDREPVYQRGNTQMVLDMCNPAVQDYVFKIFDDIMTANPEIAYIKWDCNANFRMQGSYYLKNQQHLYVDYTRGVIKTLERIRAKYPDVVIQDCSSGGARVNYGILPYFDEFWTSDQTAALQRVKIQWGTSYFFPACAMGCHVSASPDLHTGLVVPLKFRLDVASSGRLGFELQPATLNEAEKAFLRKGVETYKSIRPVVQQGDLYRLVSPFEDMGIASLMYCTPEKDRAVYYWYKLENYIDQHVMRVPMAGLDPGAIYKVTELNRVAKKALPYEGKSFSGKFLMEEGLEMMTSRNIPWDSRVLLLEKVK